MVGTLFEVLLKGLSLWENHEKTRIQDRVLELRKEWYEEFNKPQDRRSDAVLDVLERELRELSGLFVANPGNENPPVQPPSPKP